MKKIYAMLAGAFLAILLTTGTLHFADLKLQPGQKAAIRNHRTYERFWSREVQKQVMDEQTLPIFGSSELMPLEDYRKNISSFLNGEDMNIMTIGAGNFQSLSHTMTLGAIEEGIKAGKVALFLSPQWFSVEGVSKEAFPARFSEDNLLGFLENQAISDENKTYVLNRTLSLLEQSPTQYARVERYKNSFEHASIVDTVYTKIMDEFWKVRAKYQVYRQIDDMVTELPKENLEQIDYHAMLQLAEEQGRAACTNNEFGIMDDYWNTYVKDVYEQGEVKDKEQVYVESPEYEDFKCFLNVAEELEIEVLLVHIPIPEQWSLYQGQLADVYYDNIRTMAGDYENVTLIDMTEYAGEKYFFRDVMHLGWKGWTRINEALYREFKK